MDDTTQIKIRDLKLKILKVERELAATLHNANLAAALRTGHAGQLAKAAERDRIRLEAKLEEFKTKLETLTGPAPAAEIKTPVAETKASAEPPVSHRSKEKATEKAPVAEKKPSSKKAPTSEKVEKKAASAKAPAADKPKKAPSKKKS